MRISAKEDYAVRAAIELAVAAPETVKREQIARAQEIPLAFLENILLELKRAGIAEAQRGPDGGYRLSRPPADVSIADVIRAVSGPLATVRGARPQSLDYKGSAEPLQEVWIALRGNIRAVLENVTLAHVATRKLPRSVRALVEKPYAWE
jgi:Rrf2 family protein